MNYKPLGKYIQPVVGRNNDLGDLPLMGLSIQKKFIPSIANTIGTDMSTYRIIERNQFAYGPVTSRNGDKITIALFDEYEKALISQAYIPFEVTDHNKLDPEYLMMWFRRPEFDRYARFKSHGSAREIFSWDEMQEVTLPIPHISKQREIVAEYNTIQNRIKLNEQLIQKLEETAQAIYREWFVEFEFPDENGKPYKSNGGKMVWNEELEKEIPLGWVVKPISDLGSIKAGGDKPKVFSETKSSKCKIPIYSNGITNDGLYGYTNKNNYPKNSITISARGTIGFSVLRREDFDAIVRLLVLIPDFSASAIYLWQTIKQIEFDNSGSVQNQLTIPQIGVVEILFPRIEILNKYDSITSLIYQNIGLKNKENQKLTELKELLLSRLATVE
jgi:type I restriction enzyme S subunit